MGFFDIEEEKPIGPQPLNPEQKQQVYDSLLAKYQEVNNKADDEYNAAKGQADRNNLITAVLRGVSQIGNAEAVSRGAKAPDMSLFDNVQAMNNNKLNLAASERKKAVEDYLMRDRLSQEDKQRKQADDKFSRLNDPNSLDSISARELAKKMNPSGKYDSMTAAQIQPIMDTLEKTYGIDEKNKWLDIQKRWQNAANAEKAVEKAAAKQQATQEKEDKLLVPGIGMARTEAEAKELRDGIASTEAAIADLEQVKNLGTDVTLLDRDRVNKIDQLLNTAVGKLRLSLTGPGTMTEQERQMIRDSIGDPTKLFSTEEIQKNKIDQLIGNLKENNNRRLKQSVVNPKLPENLPKQITVERKDPKTGKIAIFDSETKQFIKFKD